MTIQVRISVVYTTDCSLILYSPWLEDAVMWFSRLPAVFCLRSCQQILTETLPTLPHPTPWLRIVKLLLTTCPRNVGCLLLVGIMSFLCEFIYFKIGCVQAKIFFFSSERQKQFIGFQMIKIPVNCLKATCLHVHWATCFPEQKTK